MDHTLDYLLRTQSVDALLEHPPAATTLKRVDFARVTLPDSIDTELYEIMLSPDMGPRNVAVLFPNNARRPLIWASAFGSLHRWNMALNAALGESLDEGEDDTHGKVCIVYGKHVYDCRKFMGNLYVFWATVHHGGRGLLGEGMPVLVNTDGKAEPRAVMLLRPIVNEPGDAERLPLTVESPKLMWNWKLMGGHPFVCDERHHRAPSAIAAAPLVMMTEVQARYQLTRSSAATNAASLLQTRPLLGHNQFEHSVDYERAGDDDISVELNSAGEMVTTTPRTDLRLVHVERTE
jgi:hypothetical protein